MTHAVSLCCSGHWYEFNDSYVHRINPNDVQTEHAYCLFYQLKGILHAVPHPEKTTAVRIAAEELREVAQGPDGASGASDVVELDTSSPPPLVDVGPRSTDPFSPVQSSSPTETQSDNGWDFPESAEAGASTALLY